MKLSESLKNTFIALKKCGIKEVIDGYGLMPYTEKNIKFIPQLFEKVVLLPFGIQSTKLHLHSWSDEDYENFKKFIKKNSHKVVSYDEAMNKINDNSIYKLIRFLTSKILKLKRLRLDKVSAYKIEKS